MAVDAYLGVVDPWLVVEKQSRHGGRQASPVEPQVIARKRDEHAAHPEVEPPRGVQRPHARVHHRVACLPAQPRVVLALIKRGAQAVVRVNHVLVFDCRLVVQLLTEVGPPAQACAVRCEALQPPASVAAPLFGRSKLFLARTELLVDVPQGHVPPGEVRAQTRARVPTGERTRELVGVVLAAVVQEAAQRLQGVRLASALSAWACAQVCHATGPRVKLRHTALDDGTADEVQLDRRGLPRSVHHVGPPEDRTRTRASAS